MSKQLTEIINLGGLVELTKPLMIFVNLEDKDFVDIGEQPEGDDKYCIIWVDVKTVLKIVQQNDNAIMGIIHESVRPTGYVNRDNPESKDIMSISDMGEVKFDEYPIEDISGKRFITSAMELEKAIKNEKR